MSDLSAQRLRRAGWLAGYAAATLLAFPHFAAGFTVDLGVLLAWFVPALLILGLADLTPRTAMRWGFGASLLGHALLFHWFYVVTVTYGHAPAILGFLSPLVPAVYVSCFTAVFAGAWAWLGERRAATPLIAALLWTALDYVRSWFLTGFPWASIGYAQHQNPALLGLAPWTGVYGLAFVTVWVGAGLAGALLHFQRRERLGTGIAIALVAGLAAHAIGWASASSREVAVGSIRIAGLQGNIDQGVKWNRSRADQTLSIYENLTRSAAAEGARVIVWPETAVPGALELDDEARSRVGKLARETGAVLVVGGVGVVVDRASGRVREFYDSGFVVSSAGEFVDRYDKTHLVPFGEYVPFRGLLGGLLSAVAAGIASGDVSPGAEPRSLTLPVPVGTLGPSRAAGTVDSAPAPDSDLVLRVGVPICYELLFPDLVRRFPGTGAMALLAMTNDAWYGQTGAPYQFLAMTALRSAETGLWSVRAANTGVSAIIDGRGRVREETPIFERDYVVADIPLRSADDTTFYVRHGDWFALSCWVALAGVAAVAFRRGSRHASGDDSSPE